MLKRRKESDTYLAADRRHRRSTQIAMKVDKVCIFHPALRPSSAVEEDWPVLAGAARGGTGSKGGGGPVRSSDVDTRELAGF